MWTVDIGSSDLTLNSAFWFTIENDAGNGIGSFDSEGFNITSAGQGSSSTILANTPTPSSIQSSAGGAGTGKLSTMSTLKLIQVPISNLAMQDPHPDPLLVS